MRLDRVPRRCFDALGGPANDTDGPAGPSSLRGDSRCEGFRARPFGRRPVRSWALLAALLVASSVSPAGAGINVWTTNGPEGGLIVAVAIDPTTPSTVYAGTYGGGVFKSTNGGGSWSAVNTGLDNASVFALAIDPLTPTTLYVARREEAR